MNKSFLLLFIFAVTTAIFRYHTEAEVKQLKSDVTKIENAIKVATAQNADLATQIHVREAQPRIKQLAAQHTNLQMIEPDQMKTASEFAGLINVRLVPNHEATPPTDSFIEQAIAMSELTK